MKVEKVLIATDFSEPAEKLLECAKKLKNEGLKEVILTHVVDISAAKGSALQFQEYNQEKLDESKKSLEEVGLEVETFVPVGFPANEIVHLAKQKKVDFILIASHGKGYIKQLFLGSTTFDVIRITEVPVLIEKYKDIENGDNEVVCREKFKKVLLPLDLSDCSYNMLDKIKQADDIIEEIILLSVVEKSRDEEEFKAIKAERGNKLEQIKKELSEKGFKVRAEIKTGTASENIMAVAEKEDVNSIIMPTRGTGTIKGLLLGSTANAVARKAKKPVILDPC